MHLWCDTCWTVPASCIVRYFIFLVFVARWEKRRNNDWRDTVEEIEEIEEADQVVDTSGIGSNRVGSEREREKERREEKNREEKRQNWPRTSEWGLLLKYREWELVACLLACSGWAMRGNTHRSLWRRVGEGRIKEWEKEKETETGRSKWVGADR